MAFSFLPGVQVNTVDNGLAARRAPRTKATLVIGTSGSGPADDIFQVVDRAVAAKLFGLDGTITRSMEEVFAGGCDNVILYRMGTKPMTLAKVGKRVTPITATITNVAVAGSTITYSAVNTFAPGDSITVSGLAHSYLNGVITIATANGSTFTAALSGPDAAFITSVSLATNVATFIVNNNFRVGDIVSVAGLTNSFLNGTLTVTARSATSFSAAITHADVSPTSDSGTVVLSSVPSIADSGTATKTGSVVTAGFDVVFGERTSDAAGRYKIWFKPSPNGTDPALLYVWLDEQLVYANDVAGGVVVDVGDIILSAVPGTSEGLALGTQSSPTIANAVTVTAAAALTGASATPTPLLTQAVTGIGLSVRDTYIALVSALELLAITPVDQVVCANAVFDAKNVAYNDTNTSADDVLGWLRKIEWTDGSVTYLWHDKTVDSGGNTAGPDSVSYTTMSAVTPTARLSAGYHEVHFPYALAAFCQQQETTVSGCIAFIGTNSPVGFKLADIRTWVGALPGYNSSTGAVVKDGKGLLGLPLLAGATSARLNSLCADYAAGRRGGMFATAEGQYDGTVQLDKNNNKVDVGAYLHVVADIGVMQNSFALNYAANIAGFVAGLTSNLDEKSNLTNKPVNIIQLWKANQAQLDSLFQVGVNVLRYKGLNQLPVLLHGETVATSLSDYQNLLRQRIKGLVVRVIRAEADKFIGESTIDGLQLQALKTALDSRMLELQKRGYLSKYNFTIATTEADQRIGHAQIDVTFNPADELIQLIANVGVSRR
jgi:hypothetical protein